MSIGLDILEVQGATGYYNSDLLEKGRVGTKSLEEYEFGFIHVKGVDDAGHDKSSKIKREQLVKCDQMLELIIGNL